MSSENLAIITVNAPPEPKLAIQSQRPLPDEGTDLENMAAHLAQFQARQHLLNVAGVLAREMKLPLQIQPNEGPQIELTSHSGLPEVWRIDCQAATIQQRQPDGQVRIVERSAFFPFVAAVNLIQLLLMHDRVEEEAARTSLLAWAREKMGRREEEEEPQ